MVQSARDDQVHTDLSSQENDITSLHTQILISKCFLFQRNENFMMKYIKKEGLLVF